MRSTRWPGLVWAARSKREAMLIAPSRRFAARLAGHNAEQFLLDEFAKVEMRVGLVLAAERVKGADKLLQMKIDIGEAEPRNIVAGIAESYTPEEMLGRKVVIVANLQPRKLRGLVSNGMILAASPEGGKPVLVSVAEILCPTCPDLPMPTTMTFPRRRRVSTINSTA